MTAMKHSVCGRFVVLDSLHIDRKVLGALASWAADRGLRVEDAIQLAICAFNDGAVPDRDERVPRRAVPCRTEIGAEPKRIE